MGYALRHSYVKSENFYSIVSLAPLVAPRLDRVMGHIEFAD